MPYEEPLHWGTDLGSGNETVLTLYRGSTPVLSLTRAQALRLLKSLAEVL